MPRVIWIVTLGSVLAWAARPTVAAALPEDTLRVAPFGKITIYRQSETPANLVLFLSGDGGWNKGVVDMARSISGLDALVAGISLPGYLRKIQASGEECLYPAADLENLSKEIQQRYRYPHYVTPVLIGYSSGATLVYATLVQAPATTFRGGISLGFCPDLETSRPLCPGNGLRHRVLPRGKGYWYLPASTLEVPWIALQGTIDQVCDPDSTVDYVRKVKNGEVVVLPKVGHGYAVPSHWMPQFREAFRKVAASATPDSVDPKVSELPDLPLEVVEATGQPSPADADLMALHITGDGGWGVTDKGICKALAAQGIPVVALNSLHYFWSAHSPDSTAATVGRILRYYLEHWGKERIVLLGYSFGADVLPAVANRLPADLRGRIQLLAFMGLGSTADFHFHLTSWLGRSSSKDSYPVRPEVEKLRGMKMLCFYGSHEGDALCKELPPDLVRGIELSGGHRIGKDFDPIVAEVLKAIE